MRTQNGFEDLLIGVGPKQKSYSLSHLENITIEIDGFQLENQHTVNLKIWLRPTNHLYTRGVKNKADQEKAQEENQLIRRYYHTEGNFQEIEIPPRVSTELRVFCIDKYEENKKLRLFASYLQSKPDIPCILPNKGDVRTCLSALLPKEGVETGYYLVFFKLHRVNTREVNMAVESGFVVSPDHFNVKKLNTKERQDKRSFRVILKNIIAGRDPFVGGSIKAKKKRIKERKRKAKKN
jgi:hypothetical protein